MPEQASQVSSSGAPRKSLADIDEAAAFLKVPRSWLYERTRKGTVPLIRVGKYLRFDLEDIVEWARKGCPR